MRGDEEEGEEDENVESEEVDDDDNEVFEPDENVRATRLKRGQLTKKSLGKQYRRSCKYRQLQSLSYSRNIKIY